MEPLNALYRRCGEGRACSLKMCAKLENSLPQSSDEVSKKFKVHDEHGQDEDAPD